MPSIFISYRISDSADITGRIRERLADYFGAEQIFRDVQSIPLGIDYRDYINAELDNCQVMVVVIGPTWLSAEDAEGNRRLEQPDDWVRREIETALNREIPVIPVLVGKAHLPKAEELPNSLQALAYRNSTTARADPDFDPDIARLIASLETVLAEPLSAVSTPNNLPRSGAVAFVGREAELADIHTQLHQSDRIAITALRGMGGIGKTELALQYARHHRDQGTYPGGICWLQAKEQDIGTEIVTFARTYLNLTPPDGLDLPNQVAYLWKNWPTPGDVLVVIDDVSGPDDNAAYAAIKPYLPPQESCFRVLLTTRLQLGASIQTVPINVLSEPASLELLRSLIGGDRVDQKPDTAQKLCQWLGYLPLGLELVGRFLARKPGWNLAKMQQQLNEKRLEVKALCQAQPDMTATHKSVAAAFELSWQDLEIEAQELAYCLCLYALAPISWEWLEEWYEGTDLDKLEDWRDEALVNRSLVTVVSASDALVELQLHQLIREFFRSKLEQWDGAAALKQSYCQAMVQMAQQIPQTPTHDQILAATSAIPHLAEAATTWQQWLMDESLIEPFVRLGWFYKGQGAYGQAEPWLQDCLAVARDRLGESHPDAATSLNNLASLYKSQGRYSEAEPLLQEALGLSKQVLGEVHPDVATSLNNLAGLYVSQGRYSEAEPLLQEALGLMKQLLGEAHPNVATSLNNLAELYRLQGRYNEAEPLYQEALRLKKQLLGETHPDVAGSLNNLAELYASRRYSEAEPLLQEALGLSKQVLGEVHPNVAISLNNLAGLYASQGRYSEAEPLLQEALGLKKQVLGEAHPDVATSLNNLAELYRLQGRYNEAEPLYQEALGLMKWLLGEAHPNVATNLNNLAGLYASQGRYSEAEPLAIQALQISAAALGQDNPDVGIHLGNLASLRLTQGTFTHIEAMFLQALTIFVNVVGPDHPYTTETINRLGNFVATVQAAGQASILSDHPLTQDLLRQVQGQ